MSKCSCILGDFVLNFTRSTPKAIISQHMKAKINSNHCQQINVKVSLVKTVFVQDICAGVETGQVFALLETG